MYSQLEQELIKLAKAMELIKMADETKGDEMLQQGHTISSLTKHVRGVAHTAHTARAPPIPPAPPAPHAPPRRAHPYYVAPSLTTGGTRAAAQFAEQSKQLAEVKSEIYKLKASALYPRRMQRARASNARNGRARWCEAT